MIDYISKRVDRQKARKLVNEIARKFSGNIVFSRHALSELEADDLVTADAINVIESTDSKILNEGELHNGTYRYRLETSFLMVVIVFWKDGNGMTIVTVWDKRKRSPK